MGPKKKKKNKISKDNSNSKEKSAEKKLIQLGIYADKNDEIQQDESWRDFG